MRVGIDILEIGKIKDLESLLSKIALPGEIEYIKNFKCKEGQAQRTASLWCVKEAVFKALGLGKDSWVTTKEVELCHEETGRPFVKLYSKALEQFKKLNLKEIEISLSHSNTVATAICICK